MTGKAPSWRDSKLKEKKLEERAGTPVATGQGVHGKKRGRLSQRETKTPEGHKGNCYGNRPNVHSTRGRREDIKGRHGFERGERGATPGNLEVLKKSTRSGGMEEGGSTSARGTKKPDLERTPCRMKKRKGKNLRKKQLKENSA